MNNPRKFHPARCLLRIRQIITRHQPPPSPAHNLRFPPPIILQAQYGEGVALVEGEFFGDGGLVYVECSCCLPHGLVFNVSDDTAGRWIIRVAGEEVTYRNVEWAFHLVYTVVSRLERHYGFACGLDLRPVRHY